MKADSLLYFALNVKLRTSAESWLVTMIMVAVSVATNARSLNEIVKILQPLVMEISCNESISEEGNGSWSEVSEANHRTKELSKY